MTQIKIIEGNIFTSNCQTIVNTINCSGVMGAGIALECRLRFPAMFDQYEKYCKEGKIDIGVLWLYKSPERWVLNFPTKKHWRFPTKESYLHAGLQKFMSTYDAKGIKSIAFPVLGAQNGGLEISTSISIMQSYLSACKIPVEIYKYSPTATDDLFERFKSSFVSTAPEILKISTGLRANHINLIREALEKKDIYQLNQLASVDGIGQKTLEKAFAYITQKRSADDTPIQERLGI